MVTNNSINEPTAASGTILQGQGVGTTSTFSTATYPSTTTSQQPLYSSATNTVSGLAAPSIPGVATHYDGVNFSYFNPLQETYLFDDFIGPGAANTLGTHVWATNTSGAATTINPNTITDNGHPGQMELADGTSGAGYALIRMGPGNGTNWPFVIGGGALTFIWVVQIPVVSDGTNTFIVRCGLMNSNNGQAIGSGVYFEYTNATGSPTNWQIATAKANSRTVSDSGAAMTAGTWYTLRADINAGATSIAYSINGVTTSNSPITSNIPTAQIGPCAFILGTAGSTSRTVDVDMFYIYQKLTSAR